MNEERLDEALKACFNTKFTMDERVRLQVERKIYEKQERLNNFLLCLIQIAMCIISLIIITGTFVVNRELSVFLLNYAIFGNFISAILILLFKKNIITERGVKSYE